MNDDRGLTSDRAVASESFSEIIATSKDMLINDALVHSSRAAGPVADAVIAGGHMDEQGVSCENRRLPPRSAHSVRSWPAISALALDQRWLFQSSYIR
jgi:hypothetical protein